MISSNRLQIGRYKRLDVLTQNVIGKRTISNSKLKQTNTNTIIQLTHTTIGKTNYVLLPTLYDTTKVSYPLRNKELSFSTIRLRRR